MSEKNKHNGSYEDSRDDSRSFFRRSSIPYERSTDEVWNSLSSQIGEQEQPPIRKLNQARVISAVAATLLILFSVTAFLRFYSRTVNVPNGQHMTASLPDGSEVQMNASSILTYHPYWWWLSRDVSFEGEGYFKVEKGNNFRVRSGNGTTEVLGTSFNLYSRENDYRVACITGKVKVTSNTREEVILGPGYEAEITDGVIKVSKSPDQEEKISWTKNTFKFTSVEFIEVLQEIERQYDVTILINQDPGLTYTGYFSKDMPVEDALMLLCKPFGFTFVKKSEGVYQVIKK